MKRVARLVAFSAALGACPWLPACAPTVTVAADRPIEIKIDLNHEVRVKLDREVEAMIARDAPAPGVGTRGIAEELPVGDASEVRAAKSARTIGERADGYLDVPPPGSEAARGLVARVNAERRERYESLADRYAVPLREVEKLAGARRLTQAEVGDRVMTPDGSWITKDESLRVEVTE